jgi:molecular chaperone DnaK (HSP70)
MIFNRDLLSQTINADEAVVLGGIFRGASLSKQFKVKPIVVKDIASFPIDLSYEQEINRDQKKSNLKRERERERDGSTDLFMNYMNLYLFLIF